MYQNLSLILLFFSCPQVNSFIHNNSGLASAIIICGSVALVVRVIVMILFVVVYKSFGKGLKEQSELSLIMKGL